MVSVLLAAVVVLAAVFAWTNGVHDAANAIATSLSTGALTPRFGLGMARPGQRWWAAGNLHA